MFVIGAFFISSIPSSTHAMSLGDVLKQYNLFKNAAATATVETGQPSVSVPMPLPVEAGTVLVKALNYSERSSAILAKDIKAGTANSDEVRKLQLFLISKGYLSSDPTGKYGAQTRAAVRKFQADKKIKGDGSLVGPATRKAIADEVQKVMDTAATTGATQ